METDLEESLKARTEQLSLFRDLGPPDLVHYHRVSGSKEVRVIVKGAYTRLERIIMLREWIAVLLLRWLHIYRIYGTCYLVNGSFNRELFGIPICGLG